MTGFRNWVTLKYNVNIKISKDTKTIKFKGTMGLKKFQNIKISKHSFIF